MGVSRYTERRKIRSKVKVNIIEKKEKTIVPFNGKGAIVQELERIKKEISDRIDIYQDFIRKTEQIKGDKVKIDGYPTLEQNKVKELQEEYKQRIQKENEKLNELNTVIDWIDINIGLYADDNEIMTLFNLNNSHIPFDYIRKPAWEQQAEQQLSLFDNEKDTFQELVKKAKNNITPVYDIKLIEKVAELAIYTTEYRINSLFDDDKKLKDIFITLDGIPTNIMITRKFKHEEKLSDWDKAVHDCIGQLYNHGEDPVLSLDYIADNLKGEKDDYTDSLITPIMESIERLNQYFIEYTKSLEDTNLEVKNLETENDKWKDIRVQVKLLNSRFIQVTSERGKVKTGIHILNGLPLYHESVKNLNMFTKVPKEVVAIIPTKNKRYINIARYMIQEIEIARRQQRKTFTKRFGIKKILRLGDYNPDKVSRRTKSGFLNRLDNIFERWVRLGYINDYGRDTEGREIVGYALSVSPKLELEDINSIDIDDL